jgi:hypothetical protein
MSSYIYLDFARNRYFSSIEKSVELLGSRSKESIVLIIDENNPQRIIIESRWTNSSTIKYLITLDSNNKIETIPLNMALPPLEKISVNLKEPYNTYKSIYIVTSLGNVYNPSLNSSAMRTNNLVSDKKIFSLNYLTGIDANEIKILGHNTAALKITDLSGAKQLFIFNMIDGQIISINHFSSSNGRIRIYANSIYFENEINYVDINGELFMLDNPISAVCYIGKKYIIVRGLDYAYIIHDNTTIRKIQFLYRNIECIFRDKDIILYSRGTAKLSSTRLYAYHIYRIYDGRVLWNKVIIYPFESWDISYISSFTPGSKIIISNRWTTPLSYPIFGSAIIDDSEAAVKSYLGIPSIMPNTAWGNISDDDLTDSLYYGNITFNVNNGEYPIVIKPYGGGIIHNTTDALEKYHLYIEIDIGYKFPEPIYIMFYAKLFYEYYALRIIRFYNLTNNSYMLNASIIKFSNGFEEKISQDIYLTSKISLTRIWIDGEVINNNLIIRAILKATDTNIYSSINEHTGFITLSVGELPIGRGEGIKVDSLYKGKLKVKKFISYWNTDIIFIPISEEEVILVNNIFISFKEPFRGLIGYDERAVYLLSFSVATIFDPIKLDLNRWLTGENPILKDEKSIILRLGLYRSDGFNLYFEKNLFDNNTLLLGLPTYAAIDNNIFWLIYRLPNQIYIDNG